MKKLNTREMVLIAVFSAVIAVFSQVSIPFPSGIPITLQTFIIALAGYCFGSINGSATVLVYVALGIIGIPVFSGFKGGLGAVFDITGGFIIGFIPMAFLCGIPAEKRFLRLLYGFIGVCTCHLIGILWFSVYSADIVNAFITSSLPFLFKDFISVSAAELISDKIKKYVLKYTGYNL